MVVVAGLICAQAAESADVVPVVAVAEACDVAVAETCEVAVRAILDLYATLMLVLVARPALVVVMTVVEVLISFVALKVVANATVAAASVPIEPLI